VKAVNFSYLKANSPFYWFKRRRFTNTLCLHHRTCYVCNPCPSPVA